MITIFKHDKKTEKDLLNLDKKIQINKKDNNKTILELQKKIEELEKLVKKEGN